MKVNETVVYGAHGVCKIAEHVTLKVGGREREYFVLKPVFDMKSTYYVPADNATVLQKLKRILSAEEIFEMIREIPGEDAIAVENEHERFHTYQDILNGGDRAKLIRLIRTLYLRQQKRKENKKNLLMSDERFMKDAERILYEEFAYVLKIDRDQVLPFITNQIEVEKK